eukprot:5976120-Ditylum_brightwellii.AAC.1
MTKKASYASDIHCGVMTENTAPVLATILLGKCPPCASMAVPITDDVKDLEHFWVGSTVEARG